MGFLLASGNAVQAADDPSSRLAEEILQATGVRGGLLVHLGCGDGRLTAALATGSRCLVHGLDPDAAKVGQARRHFASLGLAGKVTAGQLRGTSLPLVDNLVTLLVAEDLVGVPRDEVMRVLCPGGIAYLKEGGRWVKTVKPRPAEIDEWTHFLHGPDNNAVAGDRLVGPPRHMQWLAEPLWSRYHHTLASISGVVSSAGRLFCIVDEGPPATVQVPARWSLVARDAFSGVLLWKRPLASWADHRRPFRSGPVQLPRTLVAVDDCVYVPLGLDQPLAALDAATGRTLRTYPDTVATEEVVVHEGTVFVVVGSPVAEQALQAARRRRQGLAAADFPNNKQILAFDNGKLLWKWSDREGDRLMPLTLAAAEGRVFFQAGRGVVCLDAATGEELWRAFKAGSDEPPKAKPPLLRGPGWSVATLVVHDNVVLWASGSTLTALSVNDGRALWDCPCRPSFHAPVDVLVAGGLVWLGPEFNEGRDPHSGEVKQQNDLSDNLWTVGHHHRCYRSKATDRYVLTAWRGIEFFDLDDGNHSRNNWVRGVCQYGIMPCNGLIYAPPHACGCYMEAKLYGFWSLASQREGAAADEVPAELERGPAYGALPDPSSEAARDPVGDWPTLRHDPLRSGSTTAELPGELGQAWEAPVGRRLTAPVVAEGLVLVACRETHRVIALDAREGKLRWSFHAGGPVDSPPTVYRGLALFGSADGYVYCLRAADGQLVWRRRAAPRECFTVACEHVESLWPVHGSVLVFDGVAYLTAGRSSYLDGGIWLFGLEPATGKVVCQTRLHSRHPVFEETIAAKKTSGIEEEVFVQNATDWKTFKDPDLSDAFSMRGGVISDVLVSDGTSIYMKHLRFNRQLALQPTKGRHLFSTSRLLDGAEVHRSHWVLGTADFRNLPVAYSWIANARYRGHSGSHLVVPYGLMLAFDEQTVWGVARYPDYQLFAQANRPFSPDEEPLPDFRQTEPENVPKWQWSAKLGLRPRAMVRAGGQILLGGTPHLSQAVDPNAAYAGQEGGLLTSASAADGRKLAEYKLAAPPVWDGMAVAKGRLYLSTTDGTVRCFAAEP